MSAQQQLSTHYNLHNMYGLTEAYATHRLVHAAIRWNLQSAFCGSWVILLFPLSFLLFFLPLFIYFCYLYIFSLALIITLINNLRVGSKLKFWCELVLYKCNLTCTIQISLATVIKWISNKFISEIGGKKSVLYKLLHRTVLIHH